MVELASRLDMDWTDLLLVLDELVVVGVVDEISAPGERRQYRAAGVVDP